MPNKYYLIDLRLRTQNHSKLTVAFFFFKFLFV